MPLTAIASAIGRGGGIRQRNQIFGDCGMILTLRKSGNAAEQKDCNCSHMYINPTRSRVSYFWNLAKSCRRNHNIALPIPTPNPCIVRGTLRPRCTDQIYNWSSGKYIPYLLPPQIFLRSENDQKEGDANRHASSLSPMSTSVKSSLIICRICEKVRLFQRPMPSIRSAQ